MGAPSFYFSKKDWTIGDAVLNSSILWRRKWRAEHLAFVFIEKVKSGAIEKEKRGAAIVHSLIEKVKSGIPPPFYNTGSEERSLHRSLLHWESAGRNPSRPLLHWESKEWKPSLVPSLRMWRVEPQSSNPTMRKWREELPSSTPVLLCQWWSGRWGLRPYFLKEGLDDGHSVLNSSIPWQRKWRMELHSFIEKMKSGIPPRFYHGGSEERSLNRSLLRWESKPVSSTPSLRK